MARRVDKVIDRIDQRVNNLLDAIDNDDPIEGHIEKINLAAPFDLAALGIASTRDFLDLEGDLDDGLEIEALRNEKDTNT